MRGLIKHTYISYYRICIRPFFFNQPFTSKSILCMCGPPISIIQINGIYGLDGVVHRKIVQDKSLIQIGK